MTERIDGWACSVVNDGTLVAFDGTEGRISPASMVEAMAELSCPECTQRDWTHGEGCTTGERERKARP